LLLFFRKEDSSLIAFAELLDHLTLTPGRLAKIALLRRFFETEADPDRGWALAALTGELSFVAAKAGLIRSVAEARVDPLLFGLSYDFVGDLAETVALIWPGVSEETPPSVTEIVTALSTRPKGELAGLLTGWLDSSGADVRYALLKLITGSLRVGASARLANAARERGILFGLDCAHSIGAMPHDLSAWSVDFAFWCHYKYLSAGPGSAAGLYLNRRHFGKAPGLAGWFSNRKQTQFDMASMLDAAPDANALHIGTPNILSMAPLQGSLEIVAAAGIERIRAKSLRLTEFLIELADSELREFGFAIGTPREAERRGGHIALLHPDAAALSRALRRAGVIPDCRPPNIIRFAPAPLYNSFADCLEAVRRLKDIMTQGNYGDEMPERELVP